MSDHEQIIRQQLVNMLLVGQAHMRLEEGVANFPPDHYNTRPPQTEYTFWHLLEHIRICQWDILDYIRNPNYQYVTFPDDYWPARDAQTDAAGWNNTLSQFYADRQALVDMVQDVNHDLYAQIPHGSPGHNLLREILIVADHNAYHLGELGILRQTMGLW